MLILAILGFIFVITLPKYLPTLAIDRVINQSNDDIPELTNIAKASYNSEKYADAATVYKHIIDVLEENIANSSPEGISKLESDKAQIQVNHGRALMSNKKFVRAKSSLEKALNSGVTDSHQYLCQVYLSLGEIKSSIRACNEALEVLNVGEEPKARAYAWYHRGIALEKLEELDEALSSFHFAYAILALENEDTTKIRNKIEASNTFVTKDILNFVMEKESKIQSTLISQSETALTEPEEERDRKATPEPESNPYATRTYPRTTCGDDLPEAREESYFIDLYPVYREYNDLLLEKVQTNFCEDAIKHPTNNNIQLASFTSIDNANYFIEFMQPEFDNLYIGEPVSIKLPSR